jgi:hypothetical protein
VLQLALLVAKTAVLQLELVPMTIPAAKAGPRSENARKTQTGCSSIAGPHAAQENARQVSLPQLRASPTSVRLSLTTSAKTRTTTAPIGRRLGSAPTTLNGCNSSAANPAVLKNAVPLSAPADK